MAEKNSNIKDLKFDDKNFNKHTEFGMTLLEKSLRENGAGRSILIDKDNNIIAGNGVIEAAGQIGLEKVKIVETTGDEIVAVKRTDIKLDSTEGRRMALADNATASADLEWDWGNIRSEFSDEEIKGFGMEVPDEYGEEKEIIEDEPPEPPKNPKSKYGDIYQLGSHRLMCGDSTKQQDVDKLMNGNVADLLFTDPPYNVDVSNSKGLKIQNDNMDSVAFGGFLNDAFRCASENLKKGGAFYIWFADSEDINFREKAAENGLLIKQCIIWVKNSFTFGRQDYKWQHEPCLYGWKDGAGHYFVDEYNHPTVIEDKLDFQKMSKAEMKKLLTEIFQKNIKTTIIHENKPLVNDLHPTMKPLKMCGSLIQNSTRKGEKVLDLFGGSGSTLIVCEQINRQCYMMEYDPQYVDVIIERWENFTGEKAKKIS